MISNDSSHARTLSLSHHLLRFFEASTTAPVNKALLTNLLREDPALLANFLDTTGCACPVHPRTDSNWLASLLDSASDSEIHRFAVSCVQPWLPAELDDEHWMQLRHQLIRAHRVSALCAQLAAHVDGLDTEEASLAGLFFNLGQLMLFAQSPSRFTLSQPAAESAPVLEDEKRQWGTDHLSLAARRMRRWPLDSHLVDAVQLLFQPADHYDNSTLLVRTLHLAERLLRKAPADAGAVSDASRLLGIETGVIEQCLDTARSSTDALSWVKLDPDAFCARQNEAVTDLRSALGSLALRQVSHLELASARSLDSLATMAARQLAPYFGQTALFLASADRRYLHGFPAPGQAQRLGDMRAPLQPGDNLVAHALLENEATDSLDAESFALSMLDRQIELLMGGAGFCCLPLATADARLGVMVLRLDSPDQRALLDNHMVRGIVSNMAQLLQGFLASSDPSASEQPAQLVREIYHELSNPITAMRNQVYVLKRKSSDGDRATLDQLDNEITRIAEMLSQYRQRSQNLAQASDTLDINRVIREATARIIDQSASGRTVEMQLDDDLPSIRANRLALEQILANLIGNAIEATTGENTITVTSHGNWHIGDARYVEIGISDNGPGLPERVRDNLFSPVNSTKGGNHSGLGLSIVKNLADEMQALVHCHSDRSGTRFQLLVPCTTPHNNNKRAIQNATTQSR